jgi:hypothetical protein
MRKGEDREIILNLAEHVPGFLTLSYSLVSLSLSPFFRIGIILLTTLKVGVQMGT